MNVRTVLCYAQNRAYTHSVDGTQRRASIPEWNLADRLRKSLDHAAILSTLLQNRCSAVMYRSGW